MRTTPQSGSPIAATIVSTVAWAFDLFDLLIVLYVAGAVGRQLFPVSSPTLSLAAVFASFAVSVLLRPLGAVVFGQVADRRGRRRTLVIVLAGVGIFTALMGAVPTYAAAGLWAPTLFLALRIIQGLFVGGVVAATHTLGTESVPMRWRGVVSGLVGAGGAAIGAITASVFELVIASIFTGPSFDVWGWRVMFFTGLIGPILSYIVLARIEESPTWREAGERGQQAVPLRALLSREHRARFILSIGVIAGGGIGYYLTSGYLPTLLGSVNRLHGTTLAWILIASNCAVLFSGAITGELGQHFGRNRVMLAMGIINLIALPLITLCLAQLAASSIGWIIVCAMALGFLSNAALGPAIAFLNEGFPTMLRSRATGGAWNIGFMVGGLMPTFVALASPTVQDLPSRVAIFLVAASLLFIVTNAMSLKYQRDVPLNHVTTREPADG